MFWTKDFNLITAIDSHTGYSLPSPIFFFPLLKKNHLRGWHHSHFTNVFLTQSILFEKKKKFFRTFVQNLISRTGAKTVALTVSTKKLLLEKKNEDKKIKRCHSSFTRHFC